MSEQLTIDDLSEGERLRDDGMARVTQFSDERLIEILDYTIAQLNDMGMEWSANTLRTAFEGYESPCKPQLIGARVRAAAMRKEMVRVGYEPSTLPSTHAHPIAVWRGVAS